MSKNEADALALSELLSPLLKKVDDVQRAIEFAESKAVSEDELDEETAEELRCAEFDREWEQRRTEKRLAVLYRGTGRTPPPIEPEPEDESSRFLDELGAAIDHVLPILSQGWPKLAAQLRVYRQQIEDRDETRKSSFSLEKFRTWLKQVTGKAPTTDDGKDGEVEPPKPAHAAPDSLPASPAAKPLEATSVGERTEATGESGGQPEGTGDGENVPPEPLDTTTCVGATQDPITIAQAALLVQKEPKTLQNPRKTSRPNPVVEAAGKNPAIYSYRALRPWLLTEFPDAAYRLPEEYAEAVKLFS